MKRLISTLNLSKEDWLRYRKCGITGTDAGAILGLRAALVDYNKAIELDPRFADAYYNRGLTNIFLGNNRQGIQDLSKAGESVFLWHQYRL